MPCWLGKESPWPAHEPLAAPNGLFHLTALAEGKEEKRELSPSYFSPFALDYPIQGDAPPPAGWQKFLAELWSKSPECVDTLQEWMGYCLTPDTRQHKILILIGPPRSGKSTIARVTGELVGKQNIAGQQLSSFKGEFGLQPLLGKTLAIVPDARLKGQSDIVLERLLSISGEDLLTVNRKNQPAVTVKLPTRLVLISNELPRFDDAAGALVRRIILLPLTEDFTGRENPNLTDELLKELPSILLWAIDGWKRLRQRGRFVQPPSGEELLRQMDELASPIKTFVADCCKIGVFLQVSHECLFSG